jgi:EmrB/QacA subfamily drug resistance transporter
VPALLLLCATQFILVLDVSVATVALPTIRDELGFSAEDLQWIITGYALTFGGFLLLGGRAADLLGRRRVFVAGLALFVAASLLAGLAQSAVMLVGARLLQGLGGALVSPAALSLLTTTFAEGPARNRAMGVWGAVAAGGGAAGLLLGGVLTELLSWRWVFLVNVPIGAAVLALAPRLLTESRSPDRSRIDVFGALLATGALLLLVFGLTSGEREGFGAPVTLLCLAVGVLLLVAFVAVERRTAHPLVPLGIFRRASLDGANIVFLAVSAVIAGMSFFGTLYLQGTLGFSPIETGLAFLPTTLTIMVVSAVVARVVDRTGPRALLAAGALLMLAGMLLLSRLSADGDYLADALPGFLLTALGLGLSFTTGMLAATAGIGEAEQGLASGLVNTSQQIGQALGLAVLATVAAAVTGGAEADPSALVDGWATAFLVGAAFALIALVAALTLVGGRPDAPRVRPALVATSGQTSGCWAGATSGGRP